MNHNVSAPPFVRPSAESIAFIVQMQRGIWGWKQQTLASIAGLSLTTVQRVERGEVVSSLSLEKLAKALGFPTGYLTVYRRKLSEEEALASMS